MFIKHCKLLPYFTRPHKLYIYVDRYLSRKLTMFPYGFRQLYKSSIDNDTTNYDRPVRTTRSGSMNRG